VPASTSTTGGQPYQDIKEKGANSIFRQEGNATFGLAAWDKGVSGIVHQAPKQRQAVKQKLLKNRTSGETQHLAHGQYKASRVSLALSLC
jgi:hypothetical protein